MPDSPPPAKRIKVDSPPPRPSHSQDDPLLEKEEEEDADDQCSICLQRLTDRALIPHCSHEFCFECLVIWADQSRRCPLCAQGIGEYVIHNVRSKYDYTRYFLPPLRSNSPVAVVAGSSSSHQRRPTRRERQWGQRERREQEAQDRLERSIRRRKWVYRHHFYAKHVASNVHTRYRPFPTPAQFAVSPDYIGRATSFLRRELQVWPNLDVEFLTTFTISIMKSLDIRSESAVKLLSEFLDMDQPYVEGNQHPNAEHFAHEMYSYLRSPFRDLYVYDEMAQYDEPEDFPARQQERIRRDNREIEFQTLPPRLNHSHSERPGDIDEGRRRRTRDATYKTKRLKRSRSGSHDRERVRQWQDPSADAYTLQRGWSESQTLASSSGPSSPAPGSQVVKGKGKATDLDKLANDLGQSTSGDTAGRTAIDNGARSTPIRELPNAEHTVIDGSKQGNSDRAPKALTLRQSIQAHLALQKTEPLKVSRPPAEPKSNTSGPDLRRGRPSLLERISGMEEVLENTLASVSAAHPDVTGNQGSTWVLRSATAQPERSGAASSNININYGGEDIIDIDSHRPDPISNAIDKDNGTVQAECTDRALRVNPKDVLERTRVRLAKMKNAMVAGVPPTAPTPPPPMPLNPSTQAELEETKPALVVFTTKNQLLERLESERRRVIGAAPGEPEVEPVAENASEGSLRAELRARNQLRARLAAARVNRRTGDA